MFESSHGHITRSMTITFVIPTPLKDQQMAWGGSVGASSQVEDEYHSLSFLTDGVGSHRWRNWGTEPVTYICITLPKPIACNLLMMRARADEWFSESPSKFQIWGSPDGVAFYKLATITTTWTQAERKTFRFTSPGPCKVYKVIFKESQGGSKLIGLSQMNLGIQGAPGS
jgi:hypothetical protein